MTADSTTKGTATGTADAPSPRTRHSASSPRLVNAPVIVANPDLAYPVNDDEVGLAVGSLYGLIALGQRVNNATKSMGMALSGSGGLGAVSAGIAEALAATALGLFVAVPAVWMYNYFLNKIERFNVEMSNSGSQLIDYFIKNEARARGRA